MGRCQFFTCLLAVGWLSNVAFVFAAEALPQKAVVAGTPTANLRAGAGIEHNLKLTLKEGDLVTIDKLDGDWYAVIAADGQSGFIHKNLLKPVADVPAPASVPPAAAPKATQPVVNTPAPAAAAPAPSAAQPAVAPAAPAIAPKPASEGGVVKSEPAPAPAEKSPAPEAAPAKPAEAKAPSILQMLESRATEVKVTLLVAAVTFVLGWFCGGSYFIRRERKRRGRIQF